MPKWIDETKLYLDFDNLWAGFDDDQCQPVLLSQRDISILVSAIKPGLWDARWVDSGGNLLRDQSRLSDLEAGKTYVEQLIARIIMGCTEWVEALNGIATAIRDTSCCGSQEGVGSYEIGENTYYGNEQPLSEPTTFGGAGDEFATEQEYLDHKCATANAIVNGMIVTLNNWSLLNLAQLTFLAIATGVALSIFLTPPVGVFIAFGLLGLGVAAFATLSSALDDNRQDLVCALYASTIATEAYDAFYGLVEDLAIDLGWAELQISTVMQILQQTGAIDTMNALYRAVDLPEVEAGVDCTGCDASAWWSCLLGTVVSFDADSVEIQGVLLGDNEYWAAVGIDSNMSMGASQVGWSPPAAVPTFACYYDAGTGFICSSGGGAAWDVKSSSFIVGPVTANKMGARSHTPFTVTYTIS